MTSPDRRPARTATLAVASTFALLTLAACGGGGGGPTSMMPPGGGGGDGSTPVVTFSPASGLPDISVIHLELADGNTLVTAPGQSIQTDQGVIPVSQGSTFRNKFVCPGVPPRGNECSITQREINGTDYRFYEDWSLDVVQQAFRDVITTGSYQGMALLIDDTLPFILYGGAGDYSVFFSGGNYDAGHSTTFSGAFGNLHSGLPTAAQGSATWEGLMTAYHRFNPSAGEIDGASTLSYDFATDSVDLILSPIGGPIPADVPADIVWNDIPVNNDGSFYIVGHGNHNEASDPHPVLGYVDGDFYGPNAEEMSGVFERYNLVGAFGARRQ